MVLGAMFGKAGVKHFSVLHLSVFKMLLSNAFAADARLNVSLKQAASPEKILKALQIGN
jgi:hypothetical protein